MGCGYGLLTRQPRWPQRRAAFEAVRDSPTQMQLKEKGRFGMTKPGPPSPEGPDGPVVLLQGSNTNF